jgi:hypothetical protein
MRIYRALAAAAATIPLAACPVDSREGEVTPDTVMVAPTDDPGALPEAARTLVLAPAPGVTIEAEAVVMPVGASTQISVHVREGPPNSPLVARVMTGTCDAPGPLAADLEPVLTDAAGFGSSRTPVGIPVAQVANGNHLVLLTEGGPNGRRLACGRIPGPEEPSDAIETEP